MKFPAFEPIDLKNKNDALSVDLLTISQISPDLNQPRKNFHNDTLDELASSIKQYGVIQPIIVKQVDADNYQIVAGERRWRASRIAGLETIPALIQADKKQENIAISLIENIQREALNPIELAEAFNRLNKNHNLSHEAIATMIGKSRTSITNSLRLLNLSKEVRDLLINEKLEMGHARSLLTLPLEQQVILAQRIIENNLTVRDSERLVQRYKQPREKKSTPYAEEVNIWVEKLSHSLSSKVAVNINEKGTGKVVIHFSSPDEVDWLVKHFTDNVEV